MYSSEWFLNSGILMGLWGNTGWL